MKELSFKVYDYIFLILVNYFDSFLKHLIEYHKLNNKHGKGSIAIDNASNPKPIKIGRLRYQLSVIMSVINGELNAAIN